MGRLIAHDLREVPLVRGHASNRMRPTALSRAHIGGRRHFAMGLCRRASPTPTCWVERVPLCGLKDGWNTGGIT